MCLHCTAWNFNFAYLNIVAYFSIPYLSPLTCLSCWWQRSQSPSLKPVEFYYGGLEVKWKDCYTDGILWYTKTSHLQIPCFIVEDERMKAEVGRLDEEVEPPQLLVRVRTISIIWIKWRRGNAAAKMPTSETNIKNPNLKSRSIYYGIISLGHFDYVILSVHHNIFYINL